MSSSSNFIRLLGLIKSNVVHTLSIALKRILSFIKTVSIIGKNTLNLKFSVVIVNLLSPLTLSKCFFA